MTIQKLYSILRKAGFTAAKYERSRQVRGWGVYSAGVRITKRDDRFKVQYEVGGIRSDENREREQMTRIIAALQAAGIQGTVSQGGLMFVVEG